MADKSHPYYVRIFHDGHGYLKSPGRFGVTLLRIDITSDGFYFEISSGGGGTELERATACLWLRDVEKDSTVHENRDLVKMWKRGLIIKL